MIAPATLIPLYWALACATVVPPPGQSATKPAEYVAVAQVGRPDKPSTLPSWDILGICTGLNQAGVQKYPSLNPK